MVDGKMDLYGTPNGFTSHSPVQSYPTGGCCRARRYKPHWEKPRVQCFAQGNFSTWTVGVGDSNRQPLRLFDDPLYQLSHGGPNALSGWSERARRPISATLFTPGCNVKVVDKEYSTNYTVITRKIQVSLCTNKQEQMCKGQTKKSDGSPGESVPWHSSAPLRLYYTTRGS